MAVDLNKQLVRRVVDEIWHPRRFDLIDNLFTPGFVNHDPDTPEARDRAGYRAWANALVTGIPDLHVTIEDLIAEGDKVAKRWTARGTHTGPLPGIAASGKAVTFSGTTIYRMEDGRVAECWWSKDMLGLLQQLGAVAAAEPA